MVLQPSTQEKCNTKPYSGKRFGVQKRPKAKPRVRSRFKPNLHFHDYFRNRARAVAGVLSESFRGAETVFRGLFWQPTPFESVFGRGGLGSSPRTLRVPVQP